LGDTATDPKLLILRLHRVPFIDVTGIQCLEDAIVGLQKRGVRVLLCEANERVLQKLHKAGVFETLSPAHYFASLSGALHAANLP
jgi:SulP family sulfate permease